jgi:lambda family phage minor tail protein L
MSPTPNVPTIAFIEKNLLATKQRWVWLYEIEVPTTPATRYRFVRDSSQVTFRGNIYYPFPISHSETRQDDKGNLPRVNMTVSNVSREVVDNLNSYGGLVGQPVRIILTHELAIATNSSIIEHDFKIVTTNINEDAVTASLGDLNLYDAKLPQQKMMRFYCRHQYQDGGCGYHVDNSDTANYLDSCDKSLNGANGCRVHGESEAAAGITILHPERFGGFPGIPEPTTQAFR